MRPAYINLFVLLFLSLATNARTENAYVRDACSVTRYQDLCIRSLASFSQEAKKSPSKWARAGVSVTIGEAKNMTQLLNRLKNNKTIRGKNRMVLSDCTELFVDTLDSLHRSLEVLRKLDAANFDVQVGDVITWISAALTNEDTCLDGFQEQKNISGQVRIVLNKVSRMTYITSNALALVNKLASTGLGTLNG